MKKILALLWIVLLCGGLMLYGFLDCPQPTAPSEAPTLSTDPEEPTTTPEEKVNCSIYVANPQSRPQWEALTADTTFSLTESAEDATILILPGEADVAEYKSRCLNLSGTTAYAQLVNWNLALSNDNQIIAIPLKMEGIGLLCDSQMLASYGKSVSEIVDYDSLQSAVQAVSAAGGTPFAALDTVMLARLLSALPADGRAFVDLYLTNGGSSSSGDGMSQLLQGEAVFHLGTTSQTSAALSILPVCLGHDDLRNHTLSIRGSNYLCIRQDVPQAQQDAALAFLDTLVTATEDKTVPIDTLQILSPFRQATYAGNTAELKFRSDLIDGKETFACTPSQSELEEMVTALEAYIAAPSDEAWAALEP